MKLFLILFVFISYYASAEYKNVYDFENTITEIRLHNNDLLIAAKGPIIAKMDSNFNVTILRENDGTESLAFFSEYDDSYYILKTNIEKNTAQVLKTDNFSNYETLYTNNTLNIFDMHVDQAGILLSVVNPDPQNYYNALVKVENSNLSVIKISKNIAFDITRISDTEIIALGIGGSNSIIYSDDNGVTFSEFPMTENTLERLQVYNNDIYVSSRDGRLLKSTNKGISWETIFDDSNYNGSASMYIKNSDTIYFCPSITNIKSVLYRTNNGGESWEALKTFDSDMIFSVTFDADKAYLGTFTGKIIYNDNITSVNEWQVLDSKPLLVSPNPASHFLNIPNNQSIESYKIVDILGNDVTSQVKLEGKSFNISTLSSGRYTLILNNTTTNFVVNR